MSIKRINTNIKLLNEITIEAILETPKQIEEKAEEYRREIRLFRDILRFIISEDSRKDDEKEKTEFCEIEGFHFKELFKPTTLCKWLLQNNVDLRNEYKGIPYTMSERVHKIGSRISTRLEKLIELGILSVDDEKIESERNKETTYRYLVERSGFLVISMLNLQNFSKGSREYRRILEFILNRILEIIPHPYRNSSNYYYYFLVELLRNCIDEYQDILDYLFKIILQNQHNLLINFSLLRSKINGRIYEKIMVEDNFRLLFYKSLYEFKTPFWERALQSKDIEDFGIDKERKEAINLVKMQFKLDTESQIDKDLSEVLKISTDPLRYINRQNRKGVDKIKILNPQIKHVSDAPILDFKVRNEWEKERNKNLSNIDHITLIVICLNRECNEIYPCSVEVGKDTFATIPCINCKKTTIYYLEI